MAYSSSTQAQAFVQYLHWLLYATSSEYSFAMHAPVAAYTKLALLLVNVVWVRAWVHTCVCACAVQVSGTFNVGPVRVQ